MAPHHRKHPPAPFKSQVSNSDGSLVLAQHTGVEGSHQFSRNDDEATPHDLIHRDTVFTLVEESRQLRQHCDSLEEENAELRQQILAMKSTQSGPTSPKIFRHDQLRSFTTSNLSGYASSTSSVSSEAAAPGKETTVCKQELEDFKDFVNTKVDATTQILEGFESALKAEGVARYKLSEDLERAKHDATRSKGRIGAMETTMREVRHDFEELAVSTTEGQKNTNATTHLGQLDEDRVERMQAQLTSTLAQLNSLTQLVQDQADAIDDLSAQLDSGPAQVASGGHEMTASDYATRINMPKKANPQPSTDVGLLQRSVDRMMRKATMQQVIDETYSKDRLQDTFQQLTFVLKDAESSSDKILHIGQFEGTYSDICSLRDRVIRRLAHCKQNGQAFAATWSAVAHS